MTFEEIKKRNGRAGGVWFDKGHMTAQRTQLHEIRAGRGGWYFIASNQDDYTPARWYGVYFFYDNGMGWQSTYYNPFVARNGRIDMALFERFESLDAARKAARDLCDDETRDYGARVLQSASNHTAYPRESRRR